MKYKIIILAALFLAGAAVLFFDTTGSKKVGKETEAPGFAVNDVISGKSLSSADLKNKIIFVHFWASW